ncbi:MAG: restriction endonuclease subunit S [Veillonella sp.]|uniref:restriction endonuclease subunit S n=1 Tax=Veillonella sp. TaxID=1926307 RepID=UPI002915A739|nr:restriction endonuclease subunit S [Veillonella sp.]MDU4514668.1 restriction endonuclease subunit S [Veillonella sp.]
MNKEKRRVPKLRFPGFTEDWEQRKLGDYLSIPEKEILEVKSANDLLTVKLNLGGVELGASRDTLSLGSTVYYKRYAGQFIYGKQNFFNGSMGIIPQKLDGKGSSGDVPSFNISNIEANYLYAYVSRESYWRPKVAAASGTGSKRIHEKTLLDFNIDIPSINEQKLISNTFDLINRFITLHQRKLEHLNLKKKALLQKLFPKNGERHPELRFPGFTDAWEQRKLGDFYTFKNGLNKEKVYFGYGDSIVNFTDVFHNRQIYSSTLKGKVCVNKKELENYKVKEGDLFFTRTSETIDEIGFPAVVMEPMERVVFSGFVLRGRAEKNDPLVNIFKSYIFFTDNFRSEMKKKSSMTTRALTSGNALKEMYFSYPKDLEEQTKIGEILLRLDNIITLHQRKLEHLQLQKKALLQQMFV